MTHPLRRTAPLIAILLFGSLLSISGHAHEHTIKADSRISAQAQASLDVVPDKAMLSARLRERTPAIAMRDDTDVDSQILREARDRLEERTAALIRTLESAGLERDAISAGSLNVRPEHVPGQRDENGESEHLVRTQLERPITLTIDDLERLPVILDALTSAGVNALDGVQYDLHDRDAATNEALIMAVEKARDKGQLLADTLQVKLGRILLVQETQAPIFVPSMAAMRADTIESHTGAIEYRPGTIRLDAGVVVEWEIEQ